MWSEDKQHKSSRAVFRGRDTLIEGRRIQVDYLDGASNLLVAVGHDL